MSREIKFRAWSNKDKRMLDYKEIWKSNLFELTHHHHELTLMQFTGLTDKNGKEIYEDDILRFEATTCDTNIKHTVIENVIFKDARFEAEVININEIFKKGASMRIYNDEVEVIGNIHQHKHLLE